MRLAELIKQGREKVPERANGAYWDRDYSVAYVSAGENPDYPVIAACAMGCAMVALGVTDATEGEDKLKALFPELYEIKTNPNEWPSCAICGSARPSLFALITHISDDHNQDWTDGPGLEEDN